MANSSPPFSPPLKPFRAHRPRPGQARDVASFPYDVINSEEARELARGNPLSFLHVGKPEIDLDPSVSLHDDRVYAKARENLDRFIAEGILVRDPVPCLYVYQQRMGDHVQAGIVGACSVREYDEDLIKKHEHTRKDKEDDRTRHMAVCNANPEPVFLAYRARPELDAIVDRIRSGPPACDFVASDGIGHTVWAIPEGREATGAPAGIGPRAGDRSVLSSAARGTAAGRSADDAARGADAAAELVRLFAEVPCLYVADGHHRTASAARHARAMRARNPRPRGEEPYESFMAVLFPHDQVRILDYNRVVKDLNGLSAAELLAKAGERFLVSPITTGAGAFTPAGAAGGGAKPSAARSFGMFLDGRWYLLEAKPGTFASDDPIGGLDISILQENLLAPVLGIGDQRTDRRIDFVGGIRGMGELEKRCREGWAVAFALFPTSLDQLMRVADAGLVMPPKSTWFEPKLRSGLFVRLLDE